MKNAHMEATTRTTSCAMSYGWGMGVLQFRLTPMYVSIGQRPWTTKEGHLQKKSANMSGPTSRTDFAVRSRVSVLLAQSERVRELVFAYAAVRRQLFAFDPEQFFVVSLG